MNLISKILFLCRYLNSTYIRNFIPLMRYHSTINSRKAKEQQEGRFILAIL